jgi:hypothetical protein
MHLGRHDLSNWVSDSRVEIHTMIIATGSGIHLMMYMLGHDDGTTTCWISTTHAQMLR